MQNMQGLQQPAQPRSNPSKGSSAADLQEAPRYQSSEAQLLAQQLRRRPSQSVDAAQSLGALPLQPIQEDSSRPPATEALQPRLSTSNAPAEQRQSMYAQQSMPRQSISGRDTTQSRQSVYADQPEARQARNGRQRAEGTPAEPRLSISTRQPANDSHSAWKTFAHEMPAQPYSPRPGVPPPIFNQARPENSRLSAPADQLGPSMLARRSLLLQDGASFGQQTPRMSLTNQQEPSALQPRGSFKQDNAASGQDPARMSLVGKQEGAFRQARMSSFQRGQSDIEAASQEDRPSPRRSMRQDESHAGLVTEPSLAPQMQPRLSMRASASDTDMQRRPLGLSGQPDDEPFSRTSPRVSMAGSSLASPSAGDPDNLHGASQQSPGRVGRDRSPSQLPQQPSRACSRPDSPSSPRSSSLEQKLPRQSLRPMSQSGFGSEVTTANLQPEASRRSSTYSTRTSLMQPSGLSQAYNEPASSSEAMPHQPSDGRSPRASMMQDPSSQTHSSRNLLEELPQLASSQPRLSSSSDLQPSMSRRPSTGAAGTWHDGASNRRMSSHDSQQSPLALPTGSASLSTSLRPQVSAYAETMQDDNPAPTDAARAYRRTSSHRSTPQDSTKHGNDHGLPWSPDHLYSQEGSLGPTLPQRASSSLRAPERQVSELSAYHQQQQAPMAADDSDVAQRRISRSPSRRESTLAGFEGQAGAVPRQNPASRSTSESRLQELPLERTHEAGEASPQQHRSPRTTWSRQASLADRASCMADAGTPSRGMSRSSTMQTQRGYSGIGEAGGSHPEALGESFTQDGAASASTRQWVEAQPRSAHPSGAQTPMRASLDGMAGLEAIQGMLDNLADQLR